MRLMGEFADIAAEVLAFLMRGRLTDFGKVLY
jgi:hypothetical protein